MEIKFTKHALGKFQHPSIIKLKIKRKSVEKVLSSLKKSVESNQYGVKIAVSSLDSGHSLKVVYKETGGIIVVITFHPAKKGRYEKRKD